MQRILLARCSRRISSIGLTCWRGSGGTFRPEEIRDLQSVCAGSANAGNQKAYSVDTGYYAGTRVVNHAAWCSINFVAQPPVNNALCDCGAELSRDGQPLWRR